jgi:hypothetical protein
MRKQSRVWTRINNIQQGLSALKDYLQAKSSKSAPLPGVASQRDSALIESAGGSQFRHRELDTNFEA